MHAIKPLAAALLSLLPALAVTANDTTTQIVITNSQIENVLTTQSDPKAPRQPIPAQDGADYLKTIPGFAVIRKGGIDGDPVLRGMAGSRLNMLLDGEQLLGGCGMRMDPPTAYVFPEAYDRVTVIKGPQTVRYGNGNSAGVVSYERDIRRFSRTESQLFGSLTAGSFGRNDQILDARTGSPTGYVQGVVTHSRAGNYRDGDGNEIHSRYSRRSANFATAWTPDDNTRLELSAAQSDGEAAYADRSMDGSMFARENTGLKFEKRHLSPLVEKVEAQLFRNYIDHVMDNYTLRSSSMPSAMNPDRLTKGARVATTLVLTPSSSLLLGADLQNNHHTLRMSMNQTTMPYENMSRMADADFSSRGLFTELNHYFNNRNRLIAGLRSDYWRAEDQRASIKVGMTNLNNPTANTRRNEQLSSGFARVEHDLSAIAGTTYLGIGRSERAPDYWELFNKESTGSISAFRTLSEKTTQLDTGMLFKGERWRASLAGFFGKIDDFILIQSNYIKPATMGTRSTTVTRNIDATLWGGEAAASYSVNRQWTVDGSLAHVRGSNDTDNLTLAQLPPLEARTGLSFNNGTWSAGSLLRVVADKNDFVANQGNIVGQDIGRTGGFAVFSINGGWRPSQAILLSAGIDNLFDRQYAEFISRSAVSIPGYTIQTTRVSEPGRVIWAKLNVNF